MTRRQPISLLLTSSIYLLLAGLMLAGCVFSRGSNARQSIRVMTWNIHHAEGTDKNIDVDRISRVIKDEKVDVVALQEVDRGTERTGKIDIITTLADLTGLTYAFGKTIDFQGGEYGNGLLTGFPIYEERNVLFRKFEDREQRGALILTLGLNGEELVVVNTHFDAAPDSSARLANAEELMNLLRAYSTRPILLCGDLNDVPGSPVVNRLKEEYLDVWELSATWKGFTYPSQAPVKRIDYVLLNRKRTAGSAVSSLFLRPVSARVIRSSASDHLPLIVEFELTTER